MFRKEHQKDFSEEGIKDDELTLTDARFINAAAQGRLWLVKRCIENGIEPTVNDNKALLRAIQYGRIGVVKYLLEMGCDPDLDDQPLSLACEKGYGRIVRHLLQHGCNNPHTLEKALLTSVSHNNTLCVNILLREGANVHAEDDAALLEACRQRNTIVVKALLDNGADVDARDGQALIEASGNGYNDVVMILAENGADVSIRDDEALKIAIGCRHILIVMTLLDHGADRNLLNDIRLDETSMILIQMHMKETIIPRLRNAIHDSMSNTDFVWQTLCSTMHPDANKLREQLHLFDLKVENDGKHEMCAALAINLERNERRRQRYDDNTVDFSGTPINDLPAWKIMLVEGIPFNCFDLFKLLKNGATLNPYTRNALPVDEIRKRQRFLRKVLTRPRFKDFNLLDTVRNTPLPTDTMLLRRKLETEVFDFLTYAPSVDIIVEATDDTIDDMLGKLKIICRRRSYFEIYYQSDNIYSMLTDGKITLIMDARGMDKKKEFVKLLCELVGKIDEHTETRRFSVTILLRYFAAREGGDNGDMDDLSFMMGNGNDGNDTDDDANFEWWFDDDS